MTVPVKRRLTAEEIAKVSSPYLSEGRKSESWEILEVDVDNKMLTARLRMSSTFTSSTDPEGFHLTIFSTMEFLSQLMIIFGHVRAGYAEKTKEGWMLDCSISSVKAIRDPENIQVRMELVSAKTRAGTILATTQSQVFDDSGGLFEARIRAFLA